METNILKSTTVDTRNLSTKSLDSDKIILEGQDVLETIENGTPQIKDFVNRVDISEDEYYVIWDDTGQPVEWNLPNLSFFYFPSAYTTGITYINFPLYTSESLPVNIGRCNGLKNIDLTFNDVVRFGENSFVDCKNLETIKIIANGDVFGSCKTMCRNNPKLKEAYIKVNIESFANCFEDCAALEKVTILSDNLQSISNIFYGCRALKEVNGIDYSNVKSLNYTFTYCENLTGSFNVTSNTITNISAGFRQCGFENIYLNIPNVENVFEAFYYCKNLKSLEIIGNKFTDITRLLSDCHSLESVSLDLSNTKQAFNAFCDCNSLSSISLTDLSQLENANSMFMCCRNIASFEYETPLLSIGSNMFADSGLKTFKGNLDSLKNANYMFARCGLKTFDVKLPNLESAYGMFIECKLDKPSVIKIINTLKEDNQCEDPTHTMMHLYMDASIKNDTDILNLLGPQYPNDLGTHEACYLIQNPKGINWKIYTV